MRMKPNHPSWRAPERRVMRPEPWLFGVALAAILLVEVWQTSQMAALSLDLDRTHKAFVEADAQRGFLTAEYERATTRAELTPVAEELNLARADAEQVRALPAEYLADDPSLRDAQAISTLAFAERLSRVIVPEARARDRAEH